MNDSITAGILARLDALAAKVGVTSTALWDLWIATAWRAWMPVMLAGVGVVVVAVGFRIRARYAAQPRKDDDNLDRRARQSNVEISGAILYFTLVAAALALVITLLNAITYTIEPRLYALEQLKSLLGR